MKRYRSNGKKSTDKMGFYVALSICLIAVGLAVWSAYTSINDYVNDDEDEYFASLVKETTAAVAQDLTGVTENSTEISTQLPTQVETKSVQEETVKENKGLYQTSTLPKEEQAAMQSELNSLQAVLKVNDNLICPVKNQNVIKQYSEEAVYNKTMKDYRAHTGCDFGAKEGEDVYAMCDGVVSDISVSEIYGVIVKIDSDDFSVYYCGLNSDTKIDKKQEVKQGDVIGTVSKIPGESKDESHIHIEIKVNDKLIDPLTVISNNE